MNLGSLANQSFDNSQMRNKRTQQFGICSPTSTETSKKSRPKVTNYHSDKYMKTEISAPQIKEQMHPKLTKQSSKMSNKMSGQSHKMENLLADDKWMKKGLKLKNQQAKKSQQESKEEEARLLSSHQSSQN